MQPNHSEEEIEPNCSGEGTKPNHREDQWGQNRRGRAKKRSNTLNLSTAKRREAEKCNNREP